MRCWERRRKWRYSGERIKRPLREKFTFPDLSLVVLIGASGSGKSTFARKHFLPTEVISSDYCRALVSDDENSLAATNDAFDVLHFVAAKRLAAGRLTVVDATNVKPEDRKPLIELARQYHCLPVAMVLNVAERICQDRNAVRTDRKLGNHVAHRQLQNLRRSLRGLEREGFRHVLLLSTPEESDGIVLERVPLYNNKKSERGPFDIIGDLHGCYAELVALLERLGYIASQRDGDGLARGYAPPEGRKAVFLGDLVDRGPDSPAVLRLVMQMVEDGKAYCVPGNHDMKLLRKLRGKDVQLTHGIAETLAQLEQETAEFKTRVQKFLDGLVSHYVFDEGRLTVAHAGMKEEMQGRIKPLSPRRGNPRPSYTEPVGASALGAFREALAGLRAAGAQDAEIAKLRDQIAERAPLADAFVASYRQYCWTVESLDDLKLAPFHLLASEGRTYFDRDHSWHMEMLATLSAAEPRLLRETKHRRVDLVDPLSQDDAIRWWTEHTERGGEGMVVKPLNFIHRGRKGFVQPGVKCRGREYLRIIYGPEYTLAQNLERLRSRNVGRKRSLAMREFALGVEALERFIRKEPLRRVHECVFGVLAMETEPVDPRL
jgi:predicted kinase